MKRFYFMELADGINKGVLDNRIYNNGTWGYRAYFADDPNKSHGYALPNSAGERCMFVAKY